MYENAHLEAPTSSPLALQAAPGRWLVQCNLYTNPQVSGGRFVGAVWGGTWGGYQGGSGRNHKTSFSPFFPTGFGRSPLRDVECRVERPVCEVGKSHFAFLAVIGVP